jgi:plasmid stabilization system protein ParE
MPKYQVVWTRMARIDFDENIIYLLENWTERDARQFTKKSMSAIRIIQNNPYAFAATDYKKPNFAATNTDSCTPTYGDPKEYNG